MLFIPALFAVAAADPSALEFNVRQVNSEIAKRDEADSLVYFQYTDYWAIDIGVGSPPQTVELDLTLGDHYFIVQEFYFNPENSTTYSSNKSADLNPYQIDGFYSHDTIFIGDQQISDIAFAFARNSPDYVSYLGLGFPDDSSDLDYLNMSLPMQLKKQGFISTAAYSLFLNSVDRATGNLLFGSIDESKIDGDLYKFPIVDDYYGKKSISLTLDGLYLIDTDGTHQKVADSSVSVTLDIDYEGSALPGGMLEPLYAAFQANYTMEYSPGYQALNCSVFENGGGIGLSFSGVEFDFSFRDVAVPLERDPRYCTPGFVEAQYDNPHLGLNFLRQLYVVVDLDNEEIGLAKANFEATSSSYVEMSSGIPASKAPGYRSEAPLQFMKPYPVTFDDIEPVTHLPTGTILASFNGFSTGSPSDYYTDVDSTIGKATGTGLASVLDSYHELSTITFTEKAFPTSATDSRSGSSQSEKTTSATNDRESNSASGKATNSDKKTTSTSSRPTSTSASARSSSSSSSASKSKDAAPKQAVSAGLATFGLLGFLALI